MLNSAQRVYARCAAIANLVLEEGEAAVLAAGAINAVIKALAAHPEAVAVDQ